MARQCDNTQYSVGDCSFLCHIPDVHYIYSYSWYSAIWRSECNICISCDTVLRLAKFSPVLDTTCLAELSYDLIIRQLFCRKCPNRWRFNICLRLIVFNSNNYFARMSVFQEALQLKIWQEQSICRSKSKNIQIGHSLIVTDSLVQVLELAIRTC